MIDELLSLDRSVFLLVNSFHHPIINNVMVFLSGQLLWIPLILVFLLLSYKQGGKNTLFYFLLFLILTLVATDVTSSYIMKNFFTRLRPCREIDLRPLIYSFGQKCGGKYGFVSSHAGNSMAIMVFSFLSLKIKSKFLYLLWVIPFLVAYSRVYLGVHYPGDILGGAVVGILWGALFSYFFKNLQGASR